ncbi:FapA family protein [Paenibacillus urinalis]|uniref:FapA family protein n=1 Tax=Paenibacillus urinalis TaxID=521520 RepID=A0AAX3N540_9BACL|nr:MULTISPECIES: FapA family protein [Paenibacillus]WDH84511.1 FapA family protein [Paenibacillus urinalis]WDH95977.1 FapA family protein [Paenibacillus urinalis]WDI04195.1 FapA family protein [Paenibacillus urinalis]GAK38482.1 polymerase [Paenibacillus sp. TCA20]
MTQKLDPAQYMKVLFSADHSSAVLDMIRQEEFEITAGELKAYLAQQGIVYGVHEEILQDIAKRPSAYYGLKPTVASGDDPVPGTDGFIELITNLVETGERKPLETEGGRVDYKEITQLSNVKKGQVIARRKPPEPGIPGKSVKGEAIPYRPGKEARFKPGKNVVVNAEGDAMYAALDGLVTPTDKDRINVFPVYEVNGDIDYNTGNIDFVGTVVIRGNVLTGFKVKAAGDIRVVGGVEGAELYAGGSIQVTGGIIGYNKGLIQAGVDVKSSFIQDASVQAGGSVYVTQSIMHSNIRAGKQCICEGTKGLIVGGVIQAGEKVAARTIGNTMSTVTTIEVGVVPELRNELAQLRTELKAQTESIDKTAKALHLLDQMAASGQLAPDKLSMRMKLQVTHQSSMRELAEIKERILDIEKMLEDTSNASVDVMKTIYGGSKIVIGRYTRFVKDSATRISFFYHNGDISMVPLKGM